MSSPDQLENLLGLPKPIEIDMQDLSAQLEIFRTYLEEALANIGRELTPEEYLHNVRYQLIKLQEETLSIGATAAQVIADTPLSDTPDTTASLVLFKWLDRAKTYLLLWRDVQFELQKALLLRKENRCTDTALAELVKASTATLQSASESMETTFVQELEGLQEEGAAGLHQLKAWQLLESPWPAYQQQFAALGEQSKQLHEQHTGLQEDTEAIAAIRQLISDTLSECATNVDTDRKLAQDTIRFIETNIGDKPTRIISHLESLQEQDYNRQPGRAFKEALSKKLEALSAQLKPVVATRRGMLQQREIGLQQAANRWMESEILPLLYEIWEIDELQHNSLKMALANIRNRVLVLTSDSQEEQPNLLREDVSQPLLSFLRQYVEWEANIEVQVKELNNRLEEEFWLTNVFRADRRFLPIPLQSTIQQLRLNQDAWWSGIQGWLRRQGAIIERFRRNVQQEEQLSSSEKIVRFIEQRTAKTNNQQYTSIFLTKGYIGESFWVGRQGEMQRFRALVQQWRAGYRGAVVLTGRRLAGKSLFGDIAANRYFPGNVIRLVPNSTLSLAGRSLTLSYDLNEALTFVRKYALQSKALVWIDDLELWTDAERPLGENARHLIRHIDSASNRIFFLVAMGNHALNQLDYSSQIRRVFQAEINLDEMPLEDVRQAILIRHGATHKELVTTSGETLAPQDLNRLIRRTYRASRANIGEALNQWAAITQQYDGDSVTLSTKPQYSLPNFLHADLAILLAALTRKKRTNEYRLRKRFGTPFNQRYGNLLQRLISTGLLVRGLDGWLEINEVVANELGHMLEENKYLHYTHTD